MVATVIPFSTSHVSVQIDSLTLYIHNATLMQGILGPP